jgi:hypothetical protein
MEQIERKTANLRHFPNLSFAFVNLPGIYHVFLLISTGNKSLIIEIKFFLFLSRNVGRNFMWVDILLQSLHYFLNLISVTWTVKFLSPP